MSNIVAINQRYRPKKYIPTPENNPFPQESPLYFNVHEYDMSLVPKKEVVLEEVSQKGDTREVSYDYVVPGHKALVRNIGGAPVPITVVGRNYKVVQNKELFQKIEEQFCTALSPHELDDVQVKDSLSYNGLMCIRQYIFHNVRCPVEGKSDIAFRTVVVNGFGGSSFKLMIGAIDFFCTNGMVIGEHDAYYHRHTKGLRISNVVEYIHRGVDVFYKQADIWKKWMKKDIDRVDVKEFLKSLPTMSERRAAQLERQYYIESRTHGNTIWALYSALTYFATHSEGEFKVRDTGSDNTAATLLKREEQVKRWIDGNQWMKIAV